MKKVGLGVAMSLVAAPAYSALDYGTAAPDIEGKAFLAGVEQEFSLAEALKKGPVVLFFHPAAYSLGSNMEAQRIAEYADKFEDAGATVVGISSDVIPQLKAFSADPDFVAGKFPLVADADGATAKAYGLRTLELVPGMRDTLGNPFNLPGGPTERVTFVVGQNGRIVATFSRIDDNIAPVDHPRKALDVVQDLAKSG